MGKAICQFRVPTVVKVLIPKGLDAPIRGAHNPLT